MNIFRSIDKFLNNPYLVLILGLSLIWDSTEYFFWHEKLDNWDIYFAGLLVLLIGIRWVLKSIAALIKKQDEVEDL